jgi:hypothetical protein
MSTPEPGNLPGNASLAELGFSQDQIAKLTPRAAELTKADLIALEKWSQAEGTAPTEGISALTVQDISSLAEAYPRPEVEAAAEGNVTVCCCCTPCCSCCAVAQISPVQSL